jgi:hypothetical protein
MCVTLPPRHAPNNFDNLSPIALTKHLVFHLTPVIAFQMEKRCECALLYSGQKDTLETEA